MQFLRRGDTLVVTRIDRLARSLRDLENIVHELREKGVHLKTTEQPIDTGSAAGQAFLLMLGVFAQLENNLRREHQMEGIQAAKARGVYKGRPRSIDAEEIRRLLQEGMGASAVAKRMGIGRASVYRLAGGTADRERQPTSHRPPPPRLTAMRFASTRPGQKRRGTGGDAGSSASWRLSVEKRSGASGTMQLA
jgi:DNA invertase Pin-like site-specific DNA recombinase